MIKYVLPFVLTILLLACKEGTKSELQSSTKEPKNIDFGGLYQYYHSNPKTLDQVEENKIIDFLGDNKMDAVRSRSGVYIADHKVGSGDSIKWGDHIYVHYKGYFLNGTEFDSSIKRGEPINFRVGSMVAGWNEALPFLKVGSKATFLLPSHMGYGKKGFPGYVGPDEIILFDIEILKKVNQNK